MQPPRILCEDSDIPPPEPGPVSGREAVDRAVRRRFFGGVWALPAFATNGDRRRFKQQLKIYELLAEIPERQLSGILGPTAEEDVPSKATRRYLIAATVAAKAGPEGGNAAKGLRAWRLLQLRARRMGRTDNGLPCSRATTAAIVAEEVTRATSAARGSQGGSTVGKSIQDGFGFLASALKLQVEAAYDVVDAAAQDFVSTDVARPRKHAGSMPPCIQMQLETLADRPDASVARTMSRALLVACIAHNIRLNDALNAELWVDAKDARVIAGRTTVRSKHGVPLELFAPAEGYTGRWHWWPAHAAEMAGRRHACPDFSASPAGKPSRGSCLLPGVLPKHKALPALRDLCGMEPLSMSAAEFDALGITTHSPHGTGSDLTHHLATELPFEERDARAAGHWLRDKNAPSEAPRPGGHVTQGARSARDEMAFRYTQGSGRRGERSEQLSVRRRIIKAVQDGLKRFARPWLELPRTLEAWDAFLPSFTGFECPAEGV